MSAQRTGTPARRKLRRRELDGALTEALTRRSDAVGRVGVHWEWQQLVDTGSDTTTLTAELAAAEAADARHRSETQRRRARRAERTDLTRAQLTRAENERAATET